MLAAAIAALAAAASNYPACVDGVSCLQLKPYPDQELVFDCAVANTTNATALGNVFFIHGNDGPHAKGMWGPMMVALAGRGYDTLACDNRGFSPGASPNTSAAYNYDLLAKDIFALVDAHFGAGSRFHHVAHDQGARVSWHSMKVAAGRTRFITFTSLSIPHTDAFSDALFGPNPDPKQQEHFSYAEIMD